MNTRSTATSTTNSESPISSTTRPRREVRVVLTCLSPVAAQAAGLHFPGLAPVHGLEAMAVATVADRSRLRLAVGGGLLAVLLVSLLITLIAGFVGTWRLLGRPAAPVLRSP